MKHTRLALAALFASQIQSPAVAQSILYEYEGLWGNRLGWSVAAAGDVNADGRPDFVVGSRMFGDEGRVDIYSGVDGTLLHSVLEPAGSGNLGRAVGGAGDVNADGYDDVIAGAPGKRAVVISGFDGAILHDIPGQVEFAFSVAGVGDLDADGYDDFAVGTPRWLSTNNERGFVKVYSGATGAVMYTWDGDLPGDQHGSAIAAAGDVDADGYPDVIVGMNAPSATRYIKVYSGRTGAVLHHIFGGGAFGLAVSGAGDLDGDGRAEFAVGNIAGNSQGTNTGEVLVYSGLDGSLVMTVNGSQGAELFGWSISPAGDVDGDLVPDLIVGAYETEWFVSYEMGSVSVISGADGSTIQKTYGVTENGLMGIACAGVGDLDGDGTPDYIAAAPKDGGTFGRVLVISGVCNGASAESYCSTSLNSFGPGAWISHSGSTSIAADNLTLHVSGAPPNKFGLFFWGPFPASQPFGDGQLCVGPVKIRINPPVQMNASGDAQLAVDYAAMSSSLRAGTSPYFQFWYRDPGGPGGTGFNTSNGLRLTMCQ